MTREHQLEVLAGSLGHPESPELLPDGSVLFVETDSGRVCVRHPTGLLATYSAPGGRPYGCLFGSDSRLYITQSGYDEPAHLAPRSVPPSVQRTSADGSTVEILVTEADGIPFTAPNSLTWAGADLLYVTDSGPWEPDAPSHSGYLYAVHGDHTAEILADLGPTFPNGVTLEADGAVVWVESYTRRVGRRRTDGSLEYVTTLPAGHTPEAVKADADGNLWIATFEGGGIDIIARDGTLVREIHTGGVPINFAADGAWLYVIDFGSQEEEDEHGYRPGRLVRLPCDAAPFPVSRGALS